MAAIRKLKKEINEVTTELVLECFTYNYIYPDKNEKELAGIIADGVQMRIDLIKKINAVRKSTENPLQSQMKEVRSEFQNRLDALVERISEMTISESE